MTKTTFSGIADAWGMPIYDQAISRMDRYDWVDESSRRTPEEYPYSYSAHFIWRDFDKGVPNPDISCAYTDRWSQRDYNKAEAAWAAIKKVNPSAYVTHLQKCECQSYLDAYFGEGVYEAVGYASACHISSGYHLGIFYYRKRETDVKNG